MPWAWPFRRAVRGAPVQMASMGSVAALPTGWLAAKSWSHVTAVASARIVRRDHRRAHRERCGGAVFMTDRSGSWPA